MGAPAAKGGAPAAGVLVSLLESCSFFWPGCSHGNLLIKSQLQITVNSK